MSTTTLEARDIILGVFYGKWNGLSASPGPVHFSAEAGEKPTTRVPWARVTLRHSDGPQTTLTGAIGDKRRYTQYGVLFIQLFTQIGEGETELYRIATEIRSAYNQARGLPVWFRNARLGEVGSRAMWEQLNVLVDFEYDIEE